MDRLTLVEAIRGSSARSPIFREAAISEPALGPGGIVTVEMRFDRGPIALRVTAPSDEEAYAILHELASMMIQHDDSN
jgi:hypothetical protein